MTAVGKAATQTTLASAAMAGATNIKVAASANISAGDTLTLGTGKFKELVKVKSAGANGASGSGVDLQTPLKFEHMSGIDVSDMGTGISFLPATKFPHVSGDAVQALGSGITLDKPLTQESCVRRPGGQRCCNDRWVSRTRTTSVVRWTAFSKSRLNCFAGSKWPRRRRHSLRFPAEQLERERIHHQPRACHS